jgi:CheY-like chemotaxis protein
MNSFPVGFTLHERYRIKELYRKAPLTLHYIVDDLENDKKVSLHFFYPSLFPAINSIQFLLDTISKRMALKSRYIANLDKVSIIQTEGFKSIYYTEDVIPQYSLHDRISNFSKNPYSMRDVVEQMLQVMKGVLYLSEYEVITHSLNPRSLFFGEDLGIKVSSVSFISNSQWICDNSMQCTIVGVDLRYVAPEMLMGKVVLPADTNALAYLFGVLAFEMASGVAPFEANSDTILQMHLHDDPPQLISNKSVPDWYAHLVYACLSKSPEKRPSLEEIINRLETALEEDSQDMEKYPEINTTSKYRVLFIEDNKLDQLSFARNAKSRLYGFEYTIAHNVEKAKRMIDSRSFDCIVSDYMMPDGTALDILEFAGSLPVVVVSGADKESVTSRILQAGAVEYIPKDMKYLHLEKIPEALKRIFNKIEEDSLMHSLISHAYSIHIAYCMKKIEYDIQKNLGNLQPNYISEIVSSHLNLLFDKSDLPFEDSFLPESFFCRGENETNFKFENYLMLLDRVLPVLTSGRIVGIRLVDQLDQHESNDLIDDFSLNRRMLLGLLFGCMCLVSSNSKESIKIGFKRTVSRNKGIRELTLVSLPISSNSFRNVIDDSIQNLVTFSNKIAQLLLHAEGHEIVTIQEERMLQIKKILLHEVNEIQTSLNPAQE